MYAWTTKNPLPGTGALNVEWTNFLNGVCLRKGVDIGMIPNIPDEDDTTMMHVVQESSSSEDEEEAATDDDVTMGSEAASATATAVALVTMSTPSVESTTIASNIKVAPTKEGKAVPVKKRKSSRQRITAPLTSTTTSSTTVSTTATATPTATASVAATTMTSPPAEAMVTIAPERVTPLPPVTSTAAPTAEMEVDSAGATGDEVGTGGRGKRRLR